MPLTIYSVEDILRTVPWTVEVTQQFESWWDALSEEERVSIDGMIHVLEAHGASLGAPFSGPVATSRYAPQLRQLLVPHQGRQICILYIAEEITSRLVLLTGSTPGTDDEVCPTADIVRADVVYGDYVAGRLGQH